VSGPAEGGTGPAGNPERTAVRAVTLGAGEVVFLDQTKLPGKVEFLRANSVEAVARAIETMVVRGAPAIGISAAFGLALYADLAVADSSRGGPQPTPETFLEGFQAASTRLAKTRPTAVNLFWALACMSRTARDALAASVRSSGPGAASTGSLAPGWLTAVRDRLRAEAVEIAAEDERANRRMGQYGQELLPGKCRILTHCNAGALATGGYGTALGVIRAAVEAGKDISVFVDETRPLWQGARLTAWEMVQERIPATLITDNMAGWFMSQGLIDVVIVGADRIAANGDVANKIGTYSVAVLAGAHGIPFYVAAPRSTIDLKTESGRDIVIEQRAADEVRRPYGLELAPMGIEVANPAFDVTPARLIAAIITEAGVARPPYGTSLAAQMAAG
jgi:methylthioribose-1-phosphate isomerase